MSNLRGKKQCQTLWNEWTTSSNQRIVYLMHFNAILPVCPEENGRLWRLAIMDRALLALFHHQGAVNVNLKCTRKALLARYLVRVNGQSFTTPTLFHSQHRGTFHSFPAPPPTPLSRAGFLSHITLGCSPTVPTPSPISCATAPRGVSFLCPSTDFYAWAF